MKPPLCPTCGQVDQGRMMEMLMERRPQSSEFARAFSLKDAAERMGIGLTLLRELVDAGEIPTKKVGNRVVIRATALEEYLQKEESSWPITPISDNHAVEFPPPGRGRSPRARG